MTCVAALLAALVVGGLAASARRGQHRVAIGDRVRTPEGQSRRGPSVWSRPPPDADPVATLPDVVDLLGVAAASGLPVGASLAAVGPRSPEPWRGAVAACLDAARDGQLLTEALDVLVAAIGDAARPLVAVLRAGLADGDSVASGLRRLTVDSRDLRRRRAEERARRIPVRLLLPLVACSLPAFAVLTIVPILAGALEGLRLPT